MRDRNLIVSKLNKNNADAIIVIDESTRYWLTGFSSSDGIVVFSKDEVALFLDGRYTEKAFSEKPDAKIYPCSKGLLKSACEYIESRGFKNLFVESERITLFTFESLKKYIPNVEIKGVEGFFKEFISTKDEKEIAFIKEAVKITDECFSNVLNYIKKGKTECDISAEINYFFQKNGCENAFDIIVVSGVKSSMPHGTPSSVPLTENSFITMDFGAKYKGYCSDMTRTVVLGHADNDMKFIYKTVFEANIRGINASKCGELCGDVDKAVREYIEEKGFGEYFTHSTGHSLGVEIHEKPTISRNNSALLEAGNIITVEPGIYIPKKYGVRIEDTVLILKNETVVLSKSPKELIEIAI